MGSSNGGLSAILVSVLSEVMNETQRSQVPWKHSALTGRLYFNQATERRGTLQGLQSQRSQKSKVRVIGNLRVGLLWREELRQDPQRPSPSRFIAIPQPNGKEP